MLCAEANRADNNGRHWGDMSKTQLAVLSGVILLSCTTLLDDNPFKSIAYEDLFRPQFHFWPTIALLMPYALSTFSGHAIFGFFAIMMLPQLVWVLSVMLETKGRMLKSLAKGTASVHLA